MRGKRGFTLVELMVTITIISILAVVGAVIYSSVQSSARDAKRIKDIDQIKNALEQYYLANNKYVDPTNCANAVDGGCSMAPVAGTVFDGLSSSFGTGQPPVDPDSTKNYAYFTDNTSCTSPKFVLCATMENSGKGNTTVPLPGTPFNCATFTSGAGAYCVKSNF